MKAESRCTVKGDRFVFDTEVSRFLVIRIAGCV